MANKHLGLDTRGGLYEETGTIFVSKCGKKYKTDHNSWSTYCWKAQILLPLI